MSVRNHPDIKQNYGVIKLKYRKKILNLAIGAIVCALYVVLTYISAGLGLSSGAVQLRLSEALCFMPIFTPAAIPGLFLGCIIANSLTGCALWDIIFGSLATLSGAIFTYILRETKLISLLSPVISNTVIIPFVLMFVYSLKESGIAAYLYFFLTVGLGEFISCFVLGGLLKKSLEKRNFESLFK